MIGATPTPQIYVDPSDAVNTFRLLNKRANTLRKPLTQIKNLMVADHVKNFKSQGSLFGGWPALSPETTGSGTPLVGSRSFTRPSGTKYRGEGTLLKQLSAKGRKGSGGATGVKGGTAWAGAEAFYGRFHQSGAPAGKRRGTLPKREIVGITEATHQASLSIIQKYLTS